MVTAEDRSLYIMSQPSQQLWKHRIDCDSSNNEGYSRYSVTLRTVGAQYANSTVVLGDSNSKYMHFGTGRGTFGYELPGRRIETYHIKEIDPYSCIGYQNIILHVAINDMRERSPGRTSDDPPAHDVPRHFDNFIRKVHDIQKLCPNANLIIAPALPTRIWLLNERALKFNRLLRDYVNKSNSSIRLLDLDVFVGEDGLLHTDFTKYTDPGDPLHLGRNGIVLLARIYKELKKIRTS